MAREHDVSSETSSSGRPNYKLRVLRDIFWLFLAMFVMFLGPFALLILVFAAAVITGAAAGPFVVWLIVRLVNRVGGSGVSSVLDAQREGASRREVVANPGDPS